MAMLIPGAASARSVVAPASCSWRADTLTRTSIGSACRASCHRRIWRHADSRTQRRIGDQAGLLGERDEARRQDETPSRMAPAQEWLQVLQLWRCGPHEWATKQPGTPDCLGAAGGET